MSVCSRVVTGGSRLNFYASSGVSASSPKKTSMAQQLTTGLFTKEFNSILTVSKTSIVAWDATTGACEQVESVQRHAEKERLCSFSACLSLECLVNRRHLPSGALQVLFDRDDAEVTAAGLDRSTRKALIGDSRGRVRVVNASTGDCILATQPHASPVTNVLAYNDNAFVSASTDGLVLVHEEGGARSEVLSSAQHCTDTSSLLATLKTTRF